MSTSIPINFAPSICAGVAGLSVCIGCAFRAGSAIPIAPTVEISGKAEAFKLSDSVDDSALPKPKTWYRKKKAFPCIQM